MQIYLISESVNQMLHMARDPRSPSWELIIFHFLTTVNSVKLIGQ